MPTVFDGKVCQCESPVPNFKLHTVQGEMENNQRYTVTLEGGTIDEAGLSAIKNQLWEALRPKPNRYIQDEFYRKVLDLVDQVEPVWQATRGNLS